MSDSSKNQPVESFTIPLTIGGMKITFTGKVENGKAAPDAESPAQDSAAPELRKDSGPAFLFG